LRVGRRLDSEQLTPTVRFIGRIDPSTMLGLIDGEVDVGRRGLVTHLLLAPLTRECLGRRPGEARPRPAGESPAAALQPRGLVEAQHNDDLFGKHRSLDLAPQPAE